MKKIKDKRILLFLFINILFFGLLIKMNYSVDTYLLLASPRLEYVKEYLSAGRIFTTFYFTVLSFLRIPGVVMYTLSYLIGIACSTYAIYELNKILDKYVKDKYTSILLSIFIILNPFVIELWLFIEMGIMMFSVLAIVEAFKHFDKYIEKKDKDYLKYALICMFLSLFSYQGTAALFIALTLIPIICKSKSIKEAVKNTLIGVSIYLIPSIINYLFIVIFSTQRVGGSLSLGLIFDNILKTTGALLGGFGLYPKSFTIIILLFTLILSIAYIVKSKYKATAILNILFIFLMVYVFTLIPNVIQTSDRVAIYPRTCYAFYSFIGIILVITNKKIMKNIICIFLVYMLFIEFVSFARIELNRHEVNKRDRDIILQIEDKVKEYERITKNEVNKLAIYNVNKATLFYGDLNDNINVSAIKENPSGLAAYTYYTQRKLEYVDSRVYSYYCSTIKDKEFDIKQVQIKDDTIHWCLY